ncbi:DNA translocase FtsK [Pseudodesulfovibrio senegalensis]|jgi:S-DNA-T family DNA segregation ATPase FtsK/SpoIIIE|uniref:DNA translocase FtsK n=1 Tax=Pseudodesulfovibrio senegalensis TaxID=1721087 RepID=A0A6N6N317_9BACT|nr:DNA translocase FtsK [Pseudodesulfovibrio senegalensis]KAB1441068.1 DNA translocase FtsK [Pseudodesulfovibrio senegalensis]
MARKATKETAQPVKRHRKELTGLALLFLSVFLFLSVYSFDPGDPSFNQAVSGHDVHNLMGVAGSHLAGLVVQAFGVGAVVCPILFLYWGLSLFIPRLRMTAKRWIGVAGLFLSLLAWACHPWIADVPPNAYGFVGGGFLGREIICRLTLPYLRPAGAFLLWLFVTVACLQLFIGFSWSGFFLFVQRCLAAVAATIVGTWQGFMARRELHKEKRGMREMSDDDPDAGLDADDFPLTLGETSESAAQSGQQPVVAAARENRKKRKSTNASKPAPRRPVVSSSGEYPDLALLSEPPQQADTGPNKSLLEQRAQRLTECFADFNIQGEIQQVIPGPVVTMFEYKPAPGIKVSKIENLTDDIAMALKATSVRIEAPIPGKDSVGIEIPNEERQVVYLHDVFRSNAFSKSASPLTLAIGMDIEGTPQVADLAKMPHLLVAGATGAGKSVCLNSFLLSILYKASPDEVKLLLVDPKRIELAPYASLPHLVHPVVTDMSLAKSALEWAVFEMDCRYESMAKLGVRNIEAYNKKLASLGDDRPEGLEALKNMPYLVIIIDELADLMMTAAKEVEMHIVRLAQLARAAGIHLILATQRPSVDVVTGLIKANFPTRISFFVTSKFDSRTILDAVGAERLLGRGDMLFKPSGGKLKRMHGAFVDESEIAGVVNFWNERTPQEFELDFSDWRKDDGGGVAGVGGASSDDPVYNEAVQFVLTQGKASISLIQRRFRIGFNRAARYIEQMEQDGMLGPQEGSKPRKVIKPE